MRERWSKDEKGKWENHRLNTGIMINTYSMSRTCCIYLGGCIYIIYNIVFLFFFVFQSGAVFLSISCMEELVKATCEDFTKEVTPDSRNLSHPTDIHHPVSCECYAAICAKVSDWIPDARTCSHHVLGSGWPSKRAATGQAGGTQGDRGEALRARPGAVKKCEKTMAIEIQP